MALSRSAKLSRWCALATKTIRSPLHVLHNQPSAGTDDCTVCVEPTSPPRNDVSLAQSLPSGKSHTQSSKKPEPSEVNAILWPSGEIHGEYSLPAVEEMRPAAA